MHGTGVLQGQQIRALQRSNSCRARANVTLGGMPSPGLPSCGASAVQAAAGRTSTMAELSSDSVTQHGRLLAARALQRPVHVMETWVLPPQIVSRLRDFELNLQIVRRRRSPRMAVTVKLRGRSNEVMYRVSGSISTYAGWRESRSDSSTSAQTRSRGLAGLSRAPAPLAKRTRMAPASACPRLLRAGGRSRATVRTPSTNADSGVMRYPPADGRHLVLRRLSIAERAAPHAQGGHREHGGITPFSTGNHFSTAAAASFLPEAAGPRPPRKASPPRVPRLPSAGSTYRIREPAVKRELTIGTCPARTSSGQLVRMCLDFP